MDDEKPFDLRDRLAIEVLNGILSNSQNQRLIPDMLHYIADGKYEEANERVEKVIRACYRVADMIRKVRLSAFE